MPWVGTVWFSVCGYLGVSENSEQRTDYLLKFKFKFCTQGFMHLGQM